MRADCDHCRVCGGSTHLALRQRIIGHDARYYACTTCGYLQTEYPYWLDQAYSRAINIFDTGIMHRNAVNVDRVVMTLVALGKLRGRVIDYAGGYGILVRSLRDAGVNAHWQDKYCNNLMATGFEADNEPYDLLTAFEVFEHLVHPVDEMKVMLERAPTVLLSTELVTSREPPPADWWYYGPEHGQHVGFFRRATLEWIARSFDCYLATDGYSLHVFSKKPVPHLWQTLIRLRRAAPIVTRLTMRSRTMDDFELLRRERRNTPP